jgi:ubiquinone/menaquinone biosynthesis C-methylase UbiE
MLNYRQEDDAGEPVVDERRINLIVGVSWRLSMIEAGEAAGASRGWAREAIEYFLWAFTPLRPMTARDIYELVSTNAFTTRGLYLNVGYWKNARTIDEACQSLAELVGSTAAMGPGDDVVDVGFGFAAQDVFWMEHFAPRRITGLNVTPLQVRTARERVRALGMADRIDLREGSATAMQLPSTSCDVVTAVECAFHFNTRELFLAEAFRVLRPGGRLVLADVIRNSPEAQPLRRVAQDLVWRTFAKKFAVPAENADRRDAYAKKLEAAGFAEVRVESIRNHVFPGWHRSLSQDRALLRRLHPVGRLPYRLLLRLDANTVYSAFDYVLASARKPS